MAVIKHGDQYYPSAERRCALCSTAFDDDEPVVYWGGPEDFYLHGGCSGSFVLRLARDAWQVEHDANDGQFTLTPDADR